MRNYHRSTDVIYFGKTLGDCPQTARALQEAAAREFGDEQMKLLPEPNEHGLYQTVDSRRWENEAEALRIAIVASVALLDEADGAGEKELLYACLDRLAELAGAQVFASADGVGFKK